MAQKDGKTIISDLLPVYIHFYEENTFFVSIKIESELRSFEKNNIIEHANCKTQNEVINFQI